MGGQLDRPVVQAILHLLQLVAAVGPVEALVSCPCSGRQCDVFEGVVEKVLCLHHLRRNRSQQRNQLIWWCMVAIMFCIVEYIERKMRINNKL